MERFLETLLARDDVRAASRWLETHDARTLTLQETLAGIPAPTGAEGERAAFVEERMREIGLAHVRVDMAGNVRGSWGEGSDIGAVLCAHLDTVFPADTDLSVEQVEGRLTAPGIGDNARGLAAMLAAAEACVRGGVRTPCRLLFVASVGEEGAGNLRGATHLFDDPSFRPGAFIALDGPGMDRIVHRALGSRRLRAEWHGPGGHSWAAYGVPNAAHAAGLAAARIAELALPADPRVTLSVVRLGGGTALNTIPAEAWIELDLRSESAAALEAVWTSVGAALHSAIETVNRARKGGTPALTMRTTVLGERPCGVTPEGHPLVQAALAATRLLGVTPSLAVASTDANVPISRGVPAIALGAGGRGGDSHLLSEWYENADGPAGILRALLVALAAAETAGP